MVTHCLYEFLFELRMRIANKFLFVFFSPCSLVAAVYYELDMAFSLSEFVPYQTYDMIRSYESSVYGFTLRFCQCAMNKLQDLESLLLWKFGSFFHLSGKLVESER